MRGRFHLIPLLDAEAVAEHDGELRHSGGPFALSILPIVAHAAQDQIQQFDRRLVGREVSAAAHGGAQRAIEALDRIGGVDDPPDLGREGEERDHLLPLPPPQRGDRGVFLAPWAGLEGIQGDQCGIGCGRLVDRLQRRHDLAAVLPGDIGQGVAQQMHDPYTIDVVRCAVSVPFLGAGPTLRRRRRDARFP